VVLSTGPRQPEAVRLYLRAGYTPLFDVTRPAEEIVSHGFRKELTTTTPTTTPTAMMATTGASVERSERAPEQVQLNTTGWDVDEELQHLRWVSLSFSLGPLR
jgi:hypothetical protein